jgi:hypothetical protein
MENASLFRESGPDKSNRVVDFLPQEGVATLRSSFGSPATCGPPRLAGSGRAAA